MVSDMELVEAIECFVPQNGNDESLPQMLAFMNTQLERIAISIEKIEKKINPGK